jgi:hypothetical protein
MSGVATGIVLLLAAGLLGAMFFLIRLTTDDSDKHRELKAFVNALFGGMPSGQADGQHSEGRAASRERRDVPEEERFSEPCPACGETVTHEHDECPSCGLRLQ